MKRTGSRFQCRHCFRHFGRSQAFELHFAPDGDCLCPEQLTAAGLRLNATGFWVVILCLPSKRRIGASGEAK